MVTLEELVKQTKAEPREYQARVVQSAYECLINKKMRSVLIESPTGSGKTIMALLLVKWLHENLGLSIGWVAMRRHLLVQAERENTGKGFNVPMQYISMFEKDPPKGLDMLVVDEAQHDVTSSMSHIHATANPKYILGLSATPFRADRIKLCFDTCVKDAGIATLIRDEYLSPFHHFAIPKWDVETVVAHYVKEEDRWGKSIMYFHRLAQCTQAHELLSDMGINSDVVSGSSDTEQQIEDFHSGKIKVLINCMKLTEGFDCPDLKTVFCRPSCKSVTIQMAGRVFRRHPGLPFKQVVQAAKTPYPFTKTAIPLLQHTMIDGEWRTLTINKHIEEISQRCLRALALTKTEMPAFIKKAKDKPQRLGRRRLMSGNFNSWRNNNDEAPRNDEFTAMERTADYVAGLQNRAFDS